MSPSPTVRVHTQVPAHPSAAAPPPAEPSAFGHRPDRLKTRSVTNRAIVSPVPARAAAAVNCRWVVQPGDVKHLGRRRRIGGKDHPQQQRDHGRVDPGRRGRHPQHDPNHQVGEGAQHPQLWMAPRSHQGQHTQHQGEIGRQHDHPAMSGRAARVERQVHHGRHECVIAGDPWRVRPHQRRPCRAKQHHRTACLDTHEPLERSRHHDNDATGNTARGNSAHTQLPVDSKQRLPTRLPGAPPAA